MKKQTAIFLIGLMSVIPLYSQFSEGQPALRGAIGPAFSYLISFELDKDAFKDLGSFTADFDLSAGKDLPIKNTAMLMMGFEGFGEVTPHWTIGMYAGQGEYVASTQDAADVDYTVRFTLSQVGVTAEFNTHSRSRLNLLAGSMFGIGQASLSASSSPANESWEIVISGDSTRKAFDVSAWTPVIQPYLGVRYDLSRSMGFKIISGWNEQVAAPGSWKLYHNKGISNSPEVSLRALFFRFQLFVLL